MALKIYSSADPGAYFSVSGTFDNPLPLTFNGVEGGTSLNKLYLRNDNVSYSYADVSITSVGAGLVDNVSGYSWKLSAGDTQPTEAQWSLIEAGNSIDMPSVSGIANYSPFWLRVDVPVGAPVASYTNAYLLIEAQQS